MSDHTAKTFDSFGTIASARKIIKAEVTKKIGIMALLSDPSGNINKLMQSKVGTIATKKLVFMFLAIAAIFAG